MGSYSDHSVNESKFNANLTDKRWYNIRGGIKHNPDFSIFSSFQTINRKTGKDNIQSRGEIQGMLIQNIFSKIILKL